MVTLKIIFFFHLFLSMFACASAGTRFPWSWSYGWLQAAQYVVVGTQLGFSPSALNP